MKQLLATCLAVVCGATLALAAQQALHVPYSYASIQAAIDAAEPGDKVYIAAGRYQENLIIDKPLSLIGEGYREVRIEAADPARPVVSVELDAGAAWLEGFAASGGTAGVRIETFAKAVVRVVDVLVVENEIGILAAGEGSASIARCFVVDNGTGVRVEAARTELVDTEIARGDAGVVLAGGANVTMSRCLVGLAQRAVSIHTPVCEWESGEVAFTGSVKGEGNRIFGTTADVCPEGPGSPWPDGFVDEAWREAVGEIVTAFSQGVEAYSARDYQQALEAYSVGLARLDAEIGFPLLEAYLQRNIGVVYDNLGRYEEALAAYQAARAVYVDREMEVDVAKVDTNIGIAYRNLGRYEEALAAYDSARAVFVEREMEVNVAKVDTNIGNVYAELGRYEEALAAYDSARAVFVEREMEVNVAGVDANIGNVYQNLGRYEEALAAYDLARAVFVERQMEVDVAKVDTNIGVVYGDLGRYEEALAAYDSARAVYVEREMEVDVADVDTNIGTVYDNLGRYDEALAAYQSARAVFADREMEVAVAEVDTNIGVVYDNLGRYEEALAAYESARAVYVDREMEVDVAEVDQNIGVVYHNLGRYEEALAAYQSARAVYVDRGMEVNVAEVDQNIGIVYRNLGRYEEALAKYQSALDVLDAVAAVEGMAYSYPTTRWMIHGNMGVAHEALEKPDEAVAAYESAIAVIESIRGGFTSEEIKMAWQERTQHVYERLIDLLYRMGEGESAFPYVERCRARTFLDTLYGGGVSPDQLISVEAGVSSDGVDAKAIDEAIVAARKSLLPSEAVLEYMVTEDGIFLWVITASGIGPPAFVPYPRSQLIDDVRALRETLESTNPDEVALGTGLASFYERLVQPELALLGDEIDTLVFIPSGPLWYLPFAALAMTDLEPVPMGGIASRPPHLVEHYTIAYLPSLASLPTLMSGEPQTASTALVALANPTLSEAQIESLGMPGYQYAELEDAARRFAICYAGTDETVYAATEADEPRAYQGEAGAGVEIYACHGAFNPYAPLQSKLLLAPGAESAASEGDMRRRDGDYHAWEAMLTDHRGTELVMLAACETLLPAFRNLQGAMGVLSGQDPEDVELSTDQLEQIVVGDEVVGLARAFLSSGADSVLGTLWQANPGAIEELLVTMCAHHQAGMTWGQALRNAQEDLIVNATYGNVWFWAPYQLIGRWR